MNNSLDLMRSRLVYEGGTTQQDRMIKDKRETLDRVLLYSYQGAKVRQIGTQDIFRALINPSTTKQDYDDKTISIGYEYGYKPGTIFEWVNTGTKWLIYLQDLTELAYFKGDIRKCNYEIKWKNEKGEECSTVAAIIGPKETKIKSSNIGNANLDSPNHTLNLLLPANIETLGYFKRYNKFYFQPLQEGDTPVCWRIEAIDTISMPGILEVNAIEYYSNEQKDDIEKGLVDTWVEEIPEPQDSKIKGDTFIKPKLPYTYYYDGDKEGKWDFDSRLPIKEQQNGKEITITWTTTYTGEFILSYKTDQKNIEKTIVVESLF